MSNTGLNSQVRSSGGAEPAGRSVAAGAGVGFGTKRESVAAVRAGGGQGSPPTAPYQNGGAEPAGRSVATSSKLDPASQTAEPSPFVNSDGGCQISARPDWLQGTWRGIGLEKLDEALEVLKSVTGEEFELHLDKPVTRGIRWDGYAVSPSSVQVCYRAEEEQTYQFWVSIPGTIWGTAPKRAWEALCCYLAHQREWKVTRLDLALDDYGRTLDLSQVIAAVKSGNFTGAQYYELVESGSLGRKERGTSIVLGSPKSDKRVTIYDKAVESKGRISSIRVEVRLRDELAQRVWDKLFPTFWKPELVVDYILGTVSFLEKHGKNLCRGKILGWWRQFLGYVAASPKKVKRMPRLRTIEKTASWLRRQVAPTLTALSRVVGPRLICRLLDEGDRRYKKNEWLKTLEAQFRLELKEVQEWFSKWGEQFYTKADLSLIAG